MKILLVDDEPFALRLIGHQLAQLGFTEVVALEDSQAALARLEGDIAAFELLLLDLQMPGVDGIEFLRHLDRLRFGGGLVLISGEDQRILQTANRLAVGHGLHVLGALHKPVTAAQLKDIIGTREAPAARPRAPRKEYDADRLRHAIANDELVAWFQPKVELATGRLSGVETLVRWQHPEDGLVFPDQFIGLAEEHGLIDHLTRAVLAAALRQARTWQDAGVSLHVAVNVSMDNISSLDFPDFIVSQLAAAGVPASSLVLEVTESRLMKDVLSALDILSRLRLKHIGLSIDDFGTGHSSLAQLRDVPFDELKIDKGFVHGAHQDASCRAIVEASLNMARQLSMRSVAEGVEDKDDWDQLRAMGCDVAQGYFIAKPMPGEKIVPWLAEWELRRGALAGI